MLSATTHSLHSMMQSAQLSPPQEVSAPRRSGHPLPHPKNDCPGTPPQVPNHHNLPHSPSASPTGQRVLTAHPEHRTSLHLFSPTSTLAKTRAEDQGEARSTSRPIQAIPWVDPGHGHKDHSHIMTGDPVILPPKLPSCGHLVQPQGGPRGGQSGEGKAGLTMAGLQPRVLGGRKQGRNGGGGQQAHSQTTEAQLTDMCTPPHTHMGVGGTLTSPTV
jgi:hypothetical protein